MLAYTACMLRLACKLREISMNEDEKFLEVKRLIILRLTRIKENSTIDKGSIEQIDDLISDLNA